MTLELRSARNAQGYDAGHIHVITRGRTSRPPGWSSEYVTLCGRLLGRYGTVDHPGMRPTCRDCRDRIDR